MKVKLREHRNDALLIVDLQNDFCPGGSLPVSGGDKIIPVVNKLIKKFEEEILGNLAVATKDWHPPDHSSFKEWPRHCVWDTYGSQFHPSLNTGLIRGIFYKGFWQHRDEYSGFSGISTAGFEQYRTSPRALADLGVPLDGELRVLGTRRVFVVGLATDYCVKATVLDGLKLGFEVFVVTDAIAAVNVKPDDGEKALKEMVATGARLVKSRDIRVEKVCSV